MFAHACKIGLAGIVSKRARGTMGLIDDGLARIMHQGGTFLAAGKLA